MGIFQKIEAGVYSMVETKWDTISPSFYRYITETIKKTNEYAKI